MTEEYTLTLVNDSVEMGSLCCYQEFPGRSALTLAWFAFPVAGRSQASFSWREDYQFVWGEVGKLEAGVVFEADQQLAATVGYSNEVEFTRASNGAFIFMNQRAAEQPDVFIIRQLDTIPLNTVAIGLNMTIVQAPPGSAGTAIYVLAARPNMTIQFTPRPTYHVTFGDFQAGQVFDAARISNQATVAFPQNVSHMVATLDAQMNWTVSPQT